MRRNVAKQLSRVLRREDGFTLPEMIVTMVIMVIALLALHGVFNMSIRVFSVGSDKIESTENARVALERMEREIRAAYPYDLTATPPVTRVLDVSSGGISGNRTDGDQITFYNDVSATAASNGDRKGDAADETITFYTQDTNSDGSLNLLRKQGSGTPETLTELGPGGLLRFKYFNRTTPDVEITTPSADEANIGRVHIELNVVEDGPWQDQKQDLTTDADLRNRGSN